nr:unnamed protein product [Homo sapiens]
MRAGPPMPPACAPLASQAISARSWPTAAPPTHARTTASALTLGATSAAGAQPLHRQDLQPPGDQLRQQPVPERGHLPAAHPGELRVSVQARVHRSHLCQEARAEPPAGHPSAQRLWAGLPPDPWGARAAGAAAGAPHPEGVHERAQQENPSPHRGPGHLLHHPGRAHQPGGAGHCGYRLPQQVRDLGVQPALQPHAAEEEEPAASVQQRGGPGRQHHLPREDRHDHLQQGGRRRGDLSSVPTAPSRFLEFRRAYYTRSVLIFVVFAISCVKSGERYAYIYCLCAAV